MPMFDDTIWGSRQWLRLTLEDSADPGVYDASPDAADVAYIRLANDDAFTMQADPERFEIRGAESMNEIVQVGTNSVMVRGRLNTLLYSSQANLLFKWATTLIGAGTPTTYRPNTMTCDYFDGKQAQRFLGVVVQNLSLTAQASGPVGLGFDLIAWKRDSSAPTLTEPAFSVFPTVLPFTLQHTSGTFKSGADTARVNYSQFSASWANNIAVLMSESTNPMLAFTGRNVSYSFTIRDKVSATDRANWRDNATLAKNEVQFVQSGSDTLTLQFNTKGKINSYSESTPLGDAKTVSMGVSAMFDASPTPDGSFSYTVVTP